MRPAKPDVISPYIKGFSDSITEEEGEFGTGSQEIKWPKTTDH